MMLEVKKKMKSFDDLTNLYKKIQDCDLPVYIEWDSDDKYFVTSKEFGTSIHVFDTRKDAVDFCKFLQLNIIAFVKHK